MSGKHKLAVFSLVAFFVFSFGLHFAQAAVKDTDADGLSDESETGVYRTDPQMFDTDSDTIGDGQEVLDGTDPLDQNSSHIVALTAQDPGLLGSPEKFAWYVGRASGILAFILLSGVVIFGLIMSSRAFTSFVPGATVYETHRFISWLALSTVVLHFSSFFFDNFMRMSFVEALVPFVLSRDFPTTLGYNIGLTVALGVIAFYLILILVFTSQWRAKMSPKLWRSIHYVSAVGYVLFVLHGYLTGTDSKEWWMQALYTTSVSIVAVLILVRIFARNLLPFWRSFFKNETDGSSVPPVN